MASDARGMVFFGDDGLPQHLLDEGSSSSTRRLAYCGQEMPPWWIPRLRHLVKLGGVRFPCPVCEATRQQLTGADGPISQEVDMPF